MPSVKHSRAKLSAPPHATWDPEVQVTVRFDLFPRAALHFRTPASVAEAFAESAAAQGLAHVSIHVLTSLSLPRLPCEALWP